MSEFYYRPRRPAPQRRRPPTIFVIDGRIYINAPDLYAERRLRPLADAVAEILELEQGDPVGNA